MELAVVGRHALFFDDDGAAAFVNSKEALVEWNSLSIDRYDVRHLLSDPPSSFRNNHHRNQSTPVDSDLEKEIDAERYADLREEESSPESDRPADGEAGAQYSAVPFSYGNTIGSSDQKNAEAESESSRFRPPFPLPEGLLLHLPPTEKMHQIIARTSTYVSEHGGQSEIVLRVKQGDNPTFGFLMPHHDLHPYFRYLVDHQELLKAGIDADSQKDTTLQANGVGAGGALSLLGSVYGSAEDDEAPGLDPMESKRNTSSGTTTAAHATNSNHMKEPEEAGKVSWKDDRVSKVPHLFKDKAALVSSSQINTTVKPFCGKRKESGMSSSSSGTIGKEIASAAASMSIVEMTLIEPPSDLKRSIDRVAELVLKNGNEFEANLVEQVKQHGRFEFLLRSNKYHPYYLKVLRMNQEFKNTIKGGNFEKDGSSWQVIDKKSPTNERDLMSETSDVQDLPLELDRKEKFKMFIGKSKKDAVDQPKGVEPQYGVSLDAAATAAILHAATRGIKYSNFEILKLPSSGANHLVGHEEMQASGSGNLTVSRAEGFAQKENEAAHTGMEAGMTKEQKLKAERLKRAKMFAAMIKSGAAAPGKDPVRGLSVKPPEPVISVSPKDLMTREDATEVKGPLLPLLDGDSKKCGKSEKTDSSYEKKRDHESKKRQHYRSRRHGEDEGEGEEEEDAIDQSPSQKKHKSHRSSDHHKGRSKDRHKRQEQHSSSKREESRHQHKHTSSSEDEGAYRRKKHADSDKDEHEKHWHKNPKSSKDEKRHRRSSSRHDVLCGYDDSRHRHKHDESFEADARDRSHRHKLKDSGGDENGGHRRSTKHMKGHHAEDPELEEGEISTKSSNQSLSSTGNGGISVQKAPSVSAETTEVPDDLRAKIRAMLLATL